MSSTQNPNQARAIVRILREIARERNLTFTTLSYDWIVRLEKGDLVRYIYGYNFELNSATAQMLANDKSAVSELLRYKNIPHVEHKLFLQPRLTGYVSDQGNWADMMAFAQQHDFKVVCKPNNGTGGEDVFRARSQPELEQVIHQLFQSHRAICLSPFYEIDQEYRVIILKGVCELIYAKKRPVVVGDGNLSVARLIARQVSAGVIPAAVAVRAMKTRSNRLHDVLPEGVELVLDWKHNLGLGAYPVMVEDQQLLAQLGQLALTCTQEFNITFASIDIIETKGQQLVLEVNSGIMMEHFVEMMPNGYAMAKAIYAKALDLMFAEEPA